MLFRCIFYESLIDGNWQRNDIVCCNNNAKAIILGSRKLISRTAQCQTICLNGFSCNVLVPSIRLFVVRHCIRCSSYFAYTDFRLKGLWKTTRLQAEQLIISELVKKLPAFYGIGSFIITFTRPCHWYLF
jgi:hypothetical protein